MSGFEREMQRGVSQALYRYLPGRWIDFYVKSSRESYSAHVEYWNGKPLENANTHRLLSQIWRVIRDIGEENTYGFSLLNDENSWTVLEPKTDKNSAVISEVSPLVFFCSNPKCNIVKKFYNSDAVLRNPNNRKCKKCNSVLKQIRLIYFCECGWAGPIEPIRCQKHPDEDLIKAGPYKYKCSKCKDDIEMRKVCPECNKLLFPKNYLDNAHYYAKTLNLIDLVNHKEEEYVSTSETGQFIVIAYWLKYLSIDDFKEMIKKGQQRDYEFEYEEAIEKQIEILKKSVPGSPDSFYRQIAVALLSASVSSQISMQQTAEKVKETLSYSYDRDRVFITAMQMLEYFAAKNAEEVSTLENAIKIAKILNTHANPEEYYSTAIKYGIKDAQTSGKVPFIQASYGYTRKKQSHEVGVKIRAFSRENINKTNIYATRLETEGILIELDKISILKWLIKNGWLDEHLISDLYNEEETSLWFLSNLDSRKIPMFDNISEEDPILKRIYTLIHSISHALIKQLAELCGLDKNSLSEYIFINVPAIFIYCQNSQGFNLGALFNAFEAYFDKWIQDTVNETGRCIFDPICIDSDHACIGCLFLNEISCVHFNKDLNRQYLVGHIDPVSKERIFGFWEN